MEPLARRYREDPGEFFHEGLFWAFWLSLASFPIGYGMREVMPVVCLLFQIGYYKHAWHRSVLSRFTAWPLFFCLWGMILIGIVFSNDPYRSLLHAGTGINKAYILPFIAMECVRDLKDLRRLVMACVVACFWEGLDGVWQTVTGKDFIMGYSPRATRLTGSIGDYSVGNYIAMAMIPAFGLWFVLRRRLSWGLTLFCWITALWPAFFLLIGARARSGVLAVAVALGIWATLLQWKRLPKAIVLLPLVTVIFLGLFYLAKPEALAPATVADDSRWNLWDIGWKVFSEHPWFGSGAGQYNPTFRAMGLIPTKDDITISHPHNLYLDMLYAHGIVGFTLGMTFLLGMIMWGWRRIAPHIAIEGGDPNAREYWLLATCFWIAFVCWLVNGIFGHDFYRIWWLALSMSHLGVMIGAVVNGSRPGMRFDAEGRLAVPVG
jgi:O-antigen ligase